MYDIRVIRADLLGNVRDGFDNNGEREIGNEESSYITDEHLKRVARDYFAGRYLARTKTQNLPMQRRDIKVEWQDGSEDDDDMIYEVIHEKTGTYLGNLVITKQ